MLELAFKGWWARLVTGQLKNRRYETFATLEIAEEAFMAGAEEQREVAAQPLQELEGRLLLERMDGSLRNAVAVLEAYQHLIPDNRAQLEIKLAKEVIDSPELEAALTRGAVGGTSDDV